MPPTALFGVSIGGKYASNLCLVFLLVVNMLATSGVSIGGKYVRKLCLVFLLVVNMLKLCLVFLSGGSTGFVWCFYWW